MAASLEPLQPPASSDLSTHALELKELTQKSIRLRMDFIRKSIQLSRTLSEYPSVKPQSVVLRESCRRAAHKSYGQIQTVLSKPEFSHLNLSEFQPALHELEASLAVLDGGVFQEPPKPAVPPSSLRDLTPRENEVLRLIALGHSTKEIAHLLGMTFKTAACHRYRVMDKSASTTPSV
jgi:DNA-binding CsgD family transcriptional regulator